MLYFAYGSNLNWEQMKRRCPGAIPVTKATLEGWILQFRGPLDIEESAGSKVQGVVFRITPEDLENLDAYEGFPTCYTRRTVTVVNKPKSGTEALVYVMTNIRKGRGLTSPADHYLQCVLQGHEDFSIPNNQVWAAFNRSRRRGK